jgi:hypothetical protein
MPNGNGARIGGISTLKGLVLYGAIFTFAGLYIYFIVEISKTAAGEHPSFDTALIAAAAALAGVLGSAFALEVGTTTDEGSTNAVLNQTVEAAKGSVLKQVLPRIWQALSVDPRNVNASSWPKTFGIWVYAIVASAVTITYVLNQSETPDSIKALAVAFGGYVIALVNAAYKSGASDQSSSASAGG